MPIIKKGDGIGVEEYRGVTIMDTMYKVYASVIAERLDREMEAGQMIPENQTGFRRGRGTLDNVYILTFIINNGIAKRKGKIVALFVDLKAAFDTVDRGIQYCLRMYSLVGTGE